MCMQSFFSSRLFIGNIFFFLSIVLHHFAIVCDCALMMLSVPYLIEREHPLLKSE